MNDCHSGACGGHLSGLATAQKILRAGYFWPTIFKDCISAIKKCHPCQLFSRKMRAHPAPLHPVIAVGPFAKWGIDFTTCNPPSAAGHHYIIVVMGYFTKWVEAMPTYKNDARTTTLFLLNPVIARFGIPKSIVTDHGMHFCNAIMAKLTSMLHLDHEHSSPYYPQANGQAESINHVLKSYASVDGWNTQVELEHATLFSTLGISNLYENCHGFHSFPTHLWVRGSSLDWMWNTLFEANHRTAPSYYYEE